MDNQGVLQAQTCTWHDVKVSDARHIGELLNRVRGLTVGRVVLIIEGERKQAASAFFTGYMGFRWSEQQVAGTIVRS